MGKPRFFLGTPSHSGQYHIKHQEAVCRFLASHMQAAYVGPGQLRIAHDAMHLARRSSLLAGCFNVLFHSATNANRQIKREQDRYTHFILLHADVHPHDQGERNWADLLYEEMEAQGLDVLSAIIAIKSDAEETSTAYDMPDGTMRRIPLKDIAANTTLVNGDGPHPLLINTGCMMIDLRSPWVDDVCFNISEIVRRAPNGNIQTSTIPEDWNFSRDMARWGRRFGATNKIQVDHWGDYPWPNTREAAIAAHRSALKLLGAT